ncbi:MAG: DUF547 domain-containing protein [Bacteroidota bacterium]
MKKPTIIALFAALIVFSACADNNPTANTNTDAYAKATNTPAETKPKADPATTFTPAKTTTPTTEVTLPDPIEAVKAPVKKEKAAPPVLKQPKKKKETPIKTPEKVSPPPQQKEPATTGPLVDPVVKAKNPKEVKKELPPPAIEEKKKEIVKEEVHIFNHDAFDALLRKYVSASGKVDYKGFKSAEKALDAYIMDLRAHPIRDNWSRNSKMAYWINAYNAFTIKLILKNYPVSSITKLHGGKPWDVKWIEIGANIYSLNNIENDILRPQYKDARIHFAVNCAAKSCPPLLNRAWTPNNLESYFEKQAKAFINNPQYNTISANEVKISKIFEWYAGDFGNIIDYLNKYAKTKINAGAKVTYMEYDWALNR